MSDECLISPLADLSRAFPAVAAAASWLAKPWTSPGNRGICVPIIGLLLGLAVGTRLEGRTVGHVARMVVETIGIGLSVGLGSTWLNLLMLRFAERQGWISEHRVEIPIVALAAACIAAAQVLGGSGFYPCFVSGPPRCSVLPSSGFHFDALPPVIVLVGILIEVLVFSTIMWKRL